MKRKYFLLPLLLLALITLSVGTLYAQDSVTHLEFKGIPLDGPLNKFVSQLEKAGYTVTDRTDDVVMMSGQFTGKNATIIVVGSKKSKTVWKVKVLQPKESSWYDIKSNYKKYKESYTKKYGSPSHNYEFFSRPYYEGDGYELQALRLDKCTYFTSYDVAGGVIYISMETEERLSISYEDSTNVKISRTEKENAIIDDI